jgi:hypothetical protein
VNATGHPAHCLCQFCERDRIHSAEQRARDRRFNVLIDQVRELRLAREREMQRRDHADFIGLRRLLSTLSTLKAE